MHNAALFLASLTHHPGVYQMLGADGTVLYVGKARNLKKRLSSYFSTRAKDSKTAALLKHVVDITVTITHDEAEALLLECNLVKKLQPHYNVIFRDDKSYPYILFTAASFPRITFYRVGKKRTRKREGQLFGPYADTAAVRETLILIEKIFKLRNCTEAFFAARKRPCIQYQIARCTAPCVGYISPEKYAENVQLAALFLQGKNNEVMQALASQMEQAAAQLEYERAAKIRDQIMRLREVTAQHFVSGTQGDADVAGFAFSAGVACVQLLMIRGGRMLGSRAFFPTLPTDTSPEDILTSFVEQYYLDDSRDIPREIITSAALSETEWLQKTFCQKAGRKITVSSSVRGERKKWLAMANASARQSVATRLVNQVDIKMRVEAFQQQMQLKNIQRIECIDISHTMGEETVGACVVFGSEGPLKSDYRRYRIRDVIGGDDTGAITKLLSQRFKRVTGGEGRRHAPPDVLLIDGGMPQLRAAQAALASLEIDSIFLIGVAKGRTRKPGFETLHFVDRPALHLPPDALALHFIQQIRDEAHRFAITGHRLRRDKKRVTSVLESIQGIGAKRRRDLLRHFGGIQAISRASLDEIAKAPGISRALAQKIFEAFHH